MEGRTPRLHPLPQPFWQPPCVSHPTGLAAGGAEDPAVPGQGGVGGDSGEDPPPHLLPGDEEEPCRRLCDHAHRPDGPQPLPLPPQRWGLASGGGLRRGCPRALLHPHPRLQISQGCQASSRSLSRPGELRGLEEPLRRGPERALRPALPGAQGRLRPPLPDGAMWGSSPFRGGLRFSPLPRQGGWVRTEHPGVGLFPPSINRDNRRASHCPWGKVCVGASPPNPRPGTSRAR